LPKPTLIAEQFTIEGRIEYLVYYSDGTSKMFKDYPTEEQLSG